MGRLYITLGFEEFEEIRKELKIFLEEFKVRNLPKYTFPTYLSPIVLCEEKYPVYISKIYRVIFLTKTGRLARKNPKFLKPLFTQAYAPIRLRTREVSDE